jgi:hypothetical protein
MRAPTTTPTTAPGAGLPARGAFRPVPAGQQSWMCVSANYPLSPAARFSDHHVDAKKVIAWCGSTATSTAPTGGAVCGGQLGRRAPGALAALHPNDPAFQPGFETADTSSPPLSACTATTAAWAATGGCLPHRQPTSTPGRHRSSWPHGDRETVVLMRTPEASWNGCGTVVEPGRLRGAAGSPARVRPDPLHPLRDGCRRDQGLHRLGPIARRGPAGSNSRDRPQPNAK